MAQTAHSSSVEATVSATADGDEHAFTRLVESYRRELHVHCYRMVASFADAEDLVQETFLRAWKKRDTLEGRSRARPAGEAESEGDR
jgi:RNA polymerase sigma-70 factor (ECF subfamily)